MMPLIFYAVFTLAASLRKSDKKPADLTSVPEPETLSGNGDAVSPSL
jgi:hypothetical protein